jgi:polysaccharide export outer membrane protein
MKNVLILMGTLLLAGSGAERSFAQARPEYGIVPEATVAETTTRQATARSDYKIAPHDTIVIDVFGEKDLSREFRVTVTGTINYYFLGELKVAGKTPSEVREVLTEELNRDYLVEPQITVDVKEYNLREVFVNGQVNKPGAITLTGAQELTIMSAIGRANGTTPRANRNKIKFTRPGEKERILSWDDLKDPKYNFPLQPGDIIEVGEKFL